MAAQRAKERMTVEASWDRVSEIFSDALEAPLSERAAFVAAQTDGCPDIRAEVERLLVSHDEIGGSDETGGFISEPVFPEAEEQEPQSRFAPGEILAYRFRLVRFINKGGMGEVYEAEDLELQERVALKTLRPELDSTLGTLQRFKQEIQLSRKVTHPNVCRVFDVAIHDEVRQGTRTRYLILVMELLKGENLSERLARKGPMSTEEALPLVEQMVRALDAAHGAGIIHSDLKSANVMLTEVPGTSELRAVVTDFGLAQSTGDTDISLYGPTVQLGTPAYMAPEQLEGGKTNRATDIYSLGVVMYEMVTGKQVFAGKTPLSAGMKKLTQEAPSPCTHVPDLDCRWELTILHCLERNPEKRPARARDVLTELHTFPKKGCSVHMRAFLAFAAIVCVVFLVAFVYLPMSGHTRPVAAATRSIAVLRFQNVSKLSNRAQQDSDWLGTAFADALTVELSGTESLRAIPREQVVSTRNKLANGRTGTLDNDDAGRAGDILGAEYVIYGFYSEGPTGDINVKVRLLTVKSRTVPFEIENTGTEQEISRLILKVAREMRKRLGAGSADISDEYIRSSLPFTHNAARLYSQGVHRLRMNDFGAAQKDLSQAAELEPGFAMTHAALADCWTSMGYAQRARDEARKALTLSTSLPYEERLQVEAQYFETVGSWTQAADRYQTLWKLYPDVIEYGLHYAGVLRARGSFSEALVVLASLRKLPAPLGDNPRIDLSEARLYGLSHNPDREYQLAEAAATKALRQNLLLCLGEARMLAGRARFDSGDVDRAAELFGEAEASYRAADFSAGVAHALNGLGLALKKKRRLSEALQVNTEALTIFREIGDRVSLAGLLKSDAEIFAGQGKFDSAQHEISNALAQARETADGNLCAEVLNTWADLLDKKGDVRHAQEKRQEARQVSVASNPTFTR